MKIGFIGLGNLGAPIAENILASGHELFVFNRTASKTKALVDKGATACESIEALAKSCTIVCTMVSDDAAVTSICAGQQGLLRHLAPESIHISMSTILPQTAKELAAQHAKSNIHYLAAPVFGRPEAAHTRKLNFLVSGSVEKIRQQAEPLLKDAGGAGVWDFGDETTAANTIKLCGNFLIASAVKAIGESTALAQRSGIDPQKMWQLFTRTLLNDPIYTGYSRIVMDHRFEPASFTLQLGLKDMNLVLQQAQQAGLSMPLAELLQQHMQQLVQEGKKNMDWSILSEPVH